MDAYLYDAFRLLYKEKTLNYADRLLTMNILYENIKVLNESIYSEFSNKARLNYFISYTKYGRLQSLKISDFIQLLFSGKIRSDIKLAIEV